MKIQHWFLKGNILQNAGNRWCQWTWVGVLVGGHSTPEPPPYVWGVPHSGFWWEAEWPPTAEMEKTDTLCSGHRSHSCSNREALGLRSDCSAKKTGSRKIFFFNFRFIECRELFLVAPVIAAMSVCKDRSDESTRPSIEDSGPAVLVFQAVALHTPSWQQPLLSVLRRALSWEQAPRAPLVSDLPVII